jgi:predicted nucleotidyltransferase
VARNEAKENSDIDLLVTLRPGVSLFDVAGLHLDLEKLLKQKVDILSEKGISPYIREDVLKEAIPL